MTSSIILDTHVLLWVLLEPERISKNLKQKIISAQQSRRLFISSISLWEVAMLSQKKRLNVYEPIKDFLKAIVALDGILVKEISADVASESVLLLDDFHGDPADRIIVATARVAGATLLTRDQKILSWAKNGHVKCLKV